MYRPYFALFLKDRGISASEVGLIFIVFGLSYSFLSLPFGTLSDILGRRKSLLMGIIIEALALASLPLIFDKFSAYLLAIVLGLGMAIIDPSLTAIPAEISLKQEFGKSFGIFASFLQLGLILGPLFGGIFATLYGYKPTALWLNSLSFLCLALIYVLVCC